jgi:hypothetical protein
MSLRPHLKHHFYCQLGGLQEEVDEAQVHLNHHFYGWLGQPKKGEEPQAHLNHHSCGWSGWPEAYSGWERGLPKSPLWWLIKWIWGQRKKGGNRRRASGPPLLWLIWTDPQFWGKIKIVVN